MRFVYRVWLGAAIAALFAVAWHHMELLGDGFWSMAAGDIVLSSGALPERDPFAFTSTTAPWILHMPAFQIGAAWLAQHAGLRAVLVVSALVAATAAVVAWLPHARTSAARVVTFPIALYYVLVGADDLSARGQLFGDLGFALLLVMLERMRRAPIANAAPTRGLARARRWLAPLALGAAWANLHPSFLLAIVVPLAVATVELLEPRATRPALLPFVAFAFVALLGACMNPYSFVLVIDVVKLASDPTTAHVDLFQSPDFHHIGWLLAPAIALAIVALRTRFGGARGRRADVALLVAFVAVTCVARRYGTMLVAAELMILGRVASEPFVTPAWARTAARPLLAIFTVVQIAVVAVHARERKDPLFHVPAEAAGIVEAENLPDRVMNPYHWGGYLDWAWQGRRKVFVDGRNNLFANGTFDDAMRVASLADGWGDLLDMYEIGTVLWENGAPLDRALAKHPGWQEVHRDRRAVLYVRRPR